jgi:hypothetical protein
LHDTLLEGIISIFRGAQKKPQFLLRLFGKSGFFYPTYPPFSISRPLAGITRHTARASRRTAFTAATQATKCRMEIGWLIK